MTNPFEPLLNIIKNKEVYGPILTIIIAYAIYNIVKSIVKHIINHDKANSYMAKKRRTVVDLITNVFKYIIIIISAIIILQIYNVNTTSIIASLGVASAVLGLAFQDALKDFIGGVTIILENYYIVGDYVKYKDFTGKVVSLGLKSTKIQSFDNQILVLANRNVAEVINLSQEKANVVLTIPVAYEEPTKKVEKSIYRILSKLSKDNAVVKETIKYLGIDSFSSSAVNYLICFNCKHDEQWQAQRNALVIIKDTLEEDNIKIPYDQIEVHNGKNI